MISVKQMRKSRRFRMVSSSFGALINSFKRLKTWLSLNRQKGSLIESFTWEVIGAVLFQVAGLCFFRINLFHAASVVLNLDGPFFLWGIATEISVIIGAWSVGGAFCHLLVLSWNRARIYSPDDK